MIHEFIFPLPPTLNKQIDLARDHWSKSSGVKKEWTNKICAIALSGDAPIFHGLIWQQFTWYCRLENDADNVAAAAKYINDGLVNAGVIKDDSLKYVQSPVIHYYEKVSKSADSKCRLVITDYNPWKQNVKTLQTSMWR
jgi:hypothetical protein